MKITRRRLRRIIKEEMSRLLEIDPDKIKDLASALEDIDPDSISVADSEEMERRVDQMQQDIEASG